MKIRAKVLIIFLIFMNHIVRAHPVKVDSALIKGMQQVLIETFGKRYPLSCYEKIVDLLLLLEQRLKCSLRVNSSEFEKNSLLYVQRLLTEFALFSYKAHDNLLKYKHDIVYISFLIQYTYLFFERHAPTLLEGRNHPVTSGQQYFDSNSQPSVTNDQNKPYHNHITHFILDGIISVASVGTLYILLKRYFLSGMAHEVQRFNSSVNTIFKKDDENEKRFNEILNDVGACSNKANLVEDKLNHLECLLKESMKKIEDDSKPSNQVIQTDQTKLSKPLEAIIKGCQSNVEAAHNSMLEKVKSISSVCALVEDEKLKKGKLLLDVLLGPYEQKEQPISAEELRNFFGVS